MKVRNRKSGAPRGDGGAGALRGKPTADESVVKKIVKKKKCLQANLHKAGWLCNIGEIVAPRGEDWRATPMHPHEAPGAPAGVGQLLKIERRVGAQWKAVLLVAPSMLMQLADATEAGRGLWSLIPLRGPRWPGDKGTVIGKYSGLIVARGGTDAAAARAASPLAASGRTHLACVKRGTEWVVIDGAAADILPFMHCANDPRNTGQTAACVLTEHGTLRARRGVPALDLGRPFEEQVASELSFNYGARFWAMHG